MNQNTPNPGLALRWPNPLHPYPPIEWGKEAVPWIEPSTTGGTRHPYLTVGKGRRWRNNLYGRRLCLIPEESTWQQLWEGLETDWLQVHTGWNQKDQTWLDQLHFPHDVNSPRMNVALGDSWPRRSSPLI